MERAVRAGVAALLAFILVLALAGCSSSETADTTASPDAQSTPAQEANIAIEDYTGETVTVTITQISRIVSLSPAITSTLIELGAETQIVGVDSASHGVEGAVDCGAAEFPDTAAILAVQPDLVFVGLATGDSALAELKEAGLTVIDAEAAGFSQIGGSFEFLGEIVGDEAAGKALAGQLEATVAEVTAARPAQSPVCLYVAGLSDDGVESSGPESLVGTMIELAGGTLADADSDSAQISYTAAQVEELAPDCIIYAGGVLTYEDIIESPVFSGLSAVTGGLVFEIDEQIVTEPGPGVNEGLLALSSIINEAAEGPVETAGAEPSASEVLD